MFNSSPGVRRLCVCVCAAYPGLLDRACRTGGFGRLYTERFATEAVDLGFAAPGVDEAVLVTDLIAALHRAATEAAAGHPGMRATVLVAFHVGITRVEGDDLRGSAVTRVVGLVRDLAPVTASGVLPADTLVVGMTVGLFNDIGSECDFCEGWVPMRATAAVCRAY
jgi:hypothetical protein